jgi:hypothetical protein
MAEKQDTFRLSAEEQQVLSRVEKLRRYHEARPPTPRGTPATQLLSDEERARFDAMSLKEKLAFLRGYSGPLWVRPKDEDA